MSPDGATEGFGASTREGSAAWGASLDVFLKEFEVVEFGSLKTSVSGCAGPLELPGVGAEQQGGTLQEEAAATAPPHRT